MQRPCYVCSFQGDGIRSRSNGWFLQLYVCLTYRHYENAFFLPRSNPECDGLEAELQLRWEGAGDEQIIDKKPKWQSFPGDCFGTFALANYATVSSFLKAAVPFWSGICYPER